jgi:hypothetical protein
MTTTDFPAGGYAFVPGVFQYSAGARALPGYRIERVRFANLVPVPEGFRRIAAYLQSANIPLTAFCACELRSPAPFTEEGFRTFNEAYAKVLGEWGLLALGQNPVARSNVCPEIAPPAEPSFHAFCFARPVPDAAPSFAVAGSGEVPEGRANYRDHIVAPGDLSPAGIRAKVDFVVGEMTRRMAALGFTWADTTAAQAYAVCDFHTAMADALVRPGASRHGLTWHYALPPIVGLDFEMDCRGLHVESVLPG